MSKGNTTEDNVLKLIFQSVAWADMPENDATTPCGTLTVALHTGDPGEAGTQGASETVYTNYARVGVVRSAAGWTVSAGSVSPAANIDFAECGATPGGPITHFSLGTGVASMLLYSGVVTPNITMATGVIPRLKTTSTITED